MFQIMRDPAPDEVQVFRDLVAALPWLGPAGEKQSLLSTLSEVPALFADETGPPARDH